MDNKTISKKEKLLEAGLEVFASKGFDETTVDDIVIKSECGKGTFYKYFKSKEELFDSLYEQFTLKLINKINFECNYSMKPYVFFTNYIKSFIDIYEQDRRIAIIKFAKAKMLVNGIDKNKVVDDSYSINITSFLKNYISEQIKIGTINPKLDINSIYTCIVGSIQHILYVYFKENKSFNRNDIEKIVSIIMNGVIPVC